MSKPERDAPKIAIFGAGAVGCFIGGVWQTAGLRVSLIGRTSVGDELARHGLDLSDHKGWCARIAPEEIAFSTDPAALTDADIIALCVKSNATEAAAAQIGAHVRRGATVISFQNGVGNAERLRALLPDHDVLAGMVPFNATRLGKGRWHKGMAGSLVADDAPITRWLAAAVGAGPAALRLSSDMPGILWEKLLINLNNAVNALSGKTLLAQLGERDYRRVTAACQREALRLLAAANIVPAQSGPLPPRLLPHAIAAPDFLFRLLVLRTLKIDAKARSSMADDFAAGRPTEIDYLNGEVVCLAERLGRKAPVNASLVVLVREAEAGGRRNWSARDLKEKVLG